MNYSSKQVFLSLIFAVAAVSCAVPTTPTESNSDATNPSTMTQVKTTQDSKVGSELAKAADNSNTSSEKVKLDAKDAVAVLDKKIELVGSEIVQDSNMFFPELTIKKTTADFVKILRCNASYEFKTLAGDSIKSIEGKFSELADKKWAWTQATSDNRNCKIVVEHSVAETYVDVTAPSGNYFYIINPCLSATRSKTNREECSFKISLSDPFYEYVNLFAQKLLDKSLELASAQSSLTAKLDQVRLLAKDLEDALNLCENYYALKEGDRAIQRGLINLGLSIPGWIVGSKIPMLGGFMGALMAQQMGSMILFPMLNLGDVLTPGINHCLTGEEGIQEMIKRGEFAEAKPTPEKAIERARVAARELQDKYHVTEILGQLKDLLGDVGSGQAGDGLIGKEIARIKKIMAEMKGLDERVIDIDSYVAKGNQLAKDEIAKAALPASFAPPK